MDTSSSYSKEKKERNILDSANRDYCGMQLQNRKRLSVQVLNASSSKKVQKIDQTDNSGQLDDNDPRQIKDILWEMISHIEWATEKNINNLTDLVVQKIFSNFTNLNELFILGRVCPYWKVFQKELTFKSTSLILLICPTRYIYNKAEIMRKFDQTLRVEDANNEEDVLEKFSTTLLQYEGLQQAEIEEIVDAMPNVTSLTIVLDHCLGHEIFDSVIDLLLSYNIWATRPITDFHFYARNFLDDDYDPSKLARVVVPQMQHKLFDAINTLLPGLERFTWDTDSREAYPNPWLYRQNHRESVNSSIERQWPFVSRLRELNYYSPDELVWSPLLDSVNRYANPERLERIGLNARISLHGPYFRDPLYRSLQRLNTRFYSKVTFATEVNIQICQPRNDMPCLRRLVTDFSGLTRLKIDFANDYAPTSSIAYVLQALRPLRRLTRLDLCIDIPTVSQRVLQGDALLVLDSIEPLDSVKALYLNFEHKRHSDLASPHWAQIFPSVETFELRHHCESAHIGLNGSAVGGDTERANKELLRMFARHFPLVKKLFVHSPHRTFWTKEQLDE